MFKFYPLLTVLILLLGVGQLRAQDPVFSQFYAAPLQLNPALTGLEDAPVFHLNYRNQWPSISQAYVSYAASYSQFFSKQNSGFGASVLADVAGNGIYASTQIGLHYTYSLYLSENSRLRMGLEGQFINKRLNWEELVFLDQIDPATGSVDGAGNPNPTQEARGANNLSYMDFGAGVLYQMPYFYGGFSIKHINAPSESYLSLNEVAATLPIRYTLHFGGQIPLSSGKKIRKAAYISPSILYSQQRDFKQLNLGAQSQYDIFLGGIWFRHTFSNADAVIFMLGVQQGPIKLAYSYDWTLSGLANASGGAHEVSLILNLASDKKRIDYNDCLKMFR